MKNFIKFAVVGLAGYFIGFYEMKYKAVKAITEVLINDEPNKEDSKGES